MTLPYAEVIGDPIIQSKSPIIHKHWLQALGMDGDYRHAHVTAEGLEAFLATRRSDENWRGCNVTMPHKQAIMPLLDALDPLAQQVGAVNTVVRGADGRLTGYNTDVDGVAEPLSALVSRQDAHAYIIGAGGAARAAIFGVSRGGAATTSIFNRTAHKADELAILAKAPSGKGHPLTGLIPTHDHSHIIVNATSMGMGGQNPVPIDLSGFAADTIVLIWSMHRWKRLCWLRRARAAHHRWAGDADRPGRGGFREVFRRPSPATTTMPPCGRC
jgi:shikimate dehydrogenase